MHLGLFEGLCQLQCVPVPSETPSLSACSHFPGVTSVLVALVIWGSILTAREGLLVTSTACSWETATCTSTLLQW